MNFILCLLLITILFLIYVEYSVGGVLFRSDVTGNISFHITGAISFLVNPLYNSFLWNWELLDVNYIVILIIFSILYVGLY